RIAACTDDNVMGIPVQNLPIGVGHLGDPADDSAAAGDCAGSAGAQQHRPMPRTTSATTRQRSLPSPRRSVTGHGP
ncbi:MAG: hypothetical protein ACTSSR_08085, partial [Alphaproteobacteria bacterium]